MTETTLARTGFTITGTRQSTIQATWVPNGDLVIKQGGDIVMLRPESISAFKRAVAQLGVIA